MGVPVTPAEINACVGTGDYAAKYISFLNTRYGFTITSQKDGRRILSYTLIAEPANAAELRAMQPKAPKTASKTKVVKAKAAPVAKTATKKVVPAVAKTMPTKSVADIKAANLAKLKEVGAAHKKLAKRVREFDDVTETFGTTGEVGTSFNVDGDWDSVEGLDLKNLL
jgi:hypothetical protein